MAQTRTRGPHRSARTAVVWEALTTELARRDNRQLLVVDVGGGTGGFAVPLAEAGHRVTVVDSSPDALASLVRRAADAGVGESVTAVQGDGERLTELVPAGGVDLVLCHSLLEIVDSPARVLAAVAGALRPDGAASVLVANRVAAVLGRAMTGHLDAAAAVCADPSGRAGPGDTLRRRFGVGEITDLLTAAGLAVAQIHGVRVLADLITASIAEADPETLLALEHQLSTEPPYRDIAAQLHVLARRPVP